MCTSGSCTNRGEVRNWLQRFCQNSAEMSSVAYHLQLMQGPGAVHLRRLVLLRS